MNVSSATTEYQRLATNVLRKPRRKAGSTYVYMYDRNLVLPLLERAGLLRPVLRMTDEDRRHAFNHIADGAWTVGIEPAHQGVNEMKLPQFQQDAKHLAFCEWAFQTEADDE